MIYATQKAPRLVIKGAILCLSLVSGQHFNVISALPTLRRSRPLRHSYCRMG